ncbi:MAG: MlaD family protein [Steroidobacteraceae bacterium]|nr:MlaD family protein [Steroidobacteraceae bacterium]
MEREAKYAAVGAFVILVIAMAVLFVYWYADSRDARSYTRYEVYFDGSVSGLTVGSTVRYLGVDVGRVVTMRIDPRAATRVQVIVDIDSSAPVSKETVAELSLQGVTGLLYIDLLGRAGPKKLAPPVPSERFPVIRSVRSNFDSFLATLPDAVGAANDVAHRLSMVLSDENIRAVSEMTANLQTASRALPGTLFEVSRLVRDLRTMAEDLVSVAATLRATAGETGPQVTATLQRVRGIAENLERTSARLDRAVEENSGDLRSFTRDGLPELERLLRDSRDAAVEVQDLARSLREDPSQLIYQPPRRGTEIPR